MPMIEIQHISKWYGDFQVLTDCTTSIEKGEVVGLLGPNGAGKTTTFYMIVGLEKPNCGMINISGEDVTGLPIHKRAKFGIAYLPQEASIFRKLSVEDNLLAILETTGMTKEEQHNKMESLLKEFNVNHVRTRKGAELSGGERRRVEIARCLAIEPNFILLDEPFAGVDPIAVQDIQSIVAKLKHKNIGILITDHNVYETLSITDRAYLLFEGKVLFQGTAEQLAENEIVREKYLGKDFQLRKKNL